MQADWRPFAGEWGLVLGASSGFGAATARELARRGMSVIGVHLDRKATLPLANDLAVSRRRPVGW
jgi:NAD(P)-dependent dehydrogenase (short-subunit alcohol dehydrogenase family)